MMSMRIAAFAPGRVARARRRRWAGVRLLGAGGALVTAPTLVGTPVQFQPAGEITVEAAAASRMARSVSVRSSAIMPARNSTISDSIACRYELVAAATTPNRIGP